MIRVTFAVAFGAACLWLASSAVRAAVPATLSAATTIITPGDSTDPNIAYGRGITTVVWSEADQIAFSKNPGSGWTAPISLTSGEEPSLVVDQNGTPQLTFAAFVSPTFNIYHARYVGGAWQPPGRVSSGANDASAPDIAAAPNGDLSIVWSEQVGGTPQIRLAQSTDGGATWPTNVPVPSATGSAPKIAVGSDGSIHIAWQDASSSPYRIKYTERVTTPWSLPAILSGDIITDSFAPDLVTLGGKTHVVWEQASAIRYAHGAGVSWTNGVTISTGSADEPAIALTSFGGLVAAWDTGTTITARMGGPAGWGAPQTLGTDPANASHVALASGQSGIVYGAFVVGNSPSRDIAFGDFTYTAYATYLPLIRR